MISVVIFVNNTPVFARNAVNTGEKSEKKDIYEVDTGEKIKFNPDEGIIKLSKLLLDTIKEPGVEKTEEGE